MNLKELNNLNLHINELEYAFSADDFIFLLKVPNNELHQFSSDNKSELFITSTNQSNLHIYIDTPNLTDKLRTGFEIPVSERSSEEVISIYNCIKEKEYINLVVFSEEAFHIKKLILYSHDVSLFFNWINNTLPLLEESFNFQNNYANIPIGYLIPQKTDTLFWFVSKVTEEIMQTVLDNTVDFTFKADLFEGELILYLSKDTTLISVLHLPDNIIDDSIRNDFKLLTNQNTISILINIDNMPDSNVVNLTLPIDKATIDRIKYHMAI